ncbi:MAG: hypothetical protein HRU02_06775 [Myxococcales bacterium]|nr:hypothetical protein [Myxococcales bacterium]
MRHSRAPRIAGLCTLAAAALACQSPAAAPLGSPLQESPRFAPRVPDEIDHASADLAAATLADDEAAAALALQRIEAGDVQRRARGEAPSGVVPVGIDALNTIRFRGRSYRGAVEQLLERDDVPATTRARLERALQDDPLVLARARVRDAQMQSTARLFNAVAQPAGHALSAGPLFPYQIATSVAHYLLDTADSDPLPLQRRQALTHWKDFLARYPTAEESPEIARQVEDAQQDWDRTRGQQALEDAHEALARSNAPPAFFHASRALRLNPGDPKAQRAHDDSVELARRQRARLRRSLQVDVSDPREPVPAGSRELALAMLARGGDVEAAVAALPPDSPLREEAAFALATSRGHAGDDDAMWLGMRELAKADDEGLMARHARAELSDPTRNAYGAFQQARRQEQVETVVWVLLGQAPTVPKSNTTAVARWVLSLPGRIRSIGLLPMRLIQTPFRGQGPAAARTAVYARRYLTLDPEGSHAAELRDWLEEYERDRENWLAALRVAETNPQAGTEDLEALREKAAKQALGVAIREERRDLRVAMLYNVTRGFPDTSAGRKAGELAREEAEQRRLHQVRISRGFLEENPSVTGMNGLALDPALLDDDVSNGELHPEGVMLVGGRAVELSFVAAGGDEDDPPERVTTAISEDHLARLVARLEEQSFENSLLDSDAAIEPDATRDLVFERARLGLADIEDARPGAEARYAYRGMREKYGMVRSRESILPFELVVQGSLEDLSLGAFPRMRTPRRTPDAMLYE